MIARIKTPPQIRREREHRKILSLYDELTEQDSRLGSFAKYAIIARTFKRSVNGIRRIVETSRNNIN